MSGAEAVADQTTQDPPAEPSRGRRRLLLLVAGPAALLAIGTGGWFTGILPRLIGMGHDSTDTKSHATIFIDLPEMVANLNSDPRRPRYVKLKAQIEVSRKQDVAAVNAAMARLQDLFQTYLRELRPEDLQGAAGTYRLRQELIARATVAVAPAQVQDVLFVEILVQ